MSIQSALPGSSSESHPLWQGPESWPGGCKVQSNVSQAHTAAQLLLEESWAQSCSWGFRKNKKTEHRHLGWGESLDTVTCACVRGAHTA